MKYGKHSLWKKVISSPFTLLFVLIAFVFLVRATWVIYHKADLSATRLTQVEEEFSELKDRKTDLMAEVQYLSTDQGVETEIRTKYRALKDGESLAVIVDDSKQETPILQASTTLTVSWWRRLLQKIGL
jgi:cell division protein FtsB